MIITEPAVFLTFSLKFCISLSAYFHNGRFLNLNIFKVTHTDLIEMACMLQLCVNSQMLRNGV